MTDAARLEDRGIKLTIYGAAFFVALAFGFAYATHSDGVWLDGAYSAVETLIAILSLFVARLVVRPGDETYPFGYAAFEPLLVLAKGLIILAVLIWAGADAADQLLNGGNETAAGFVMLYGLIAGLGCFLVAGRLKHYADRTDSDILHVDAKNWMIDGGLSLGIAVAFAIALLLERSPYAAWALFIDPVVVLAMVLGTLAVPIQIIRQSWFELTQRSIDHEDKADQHELAEQVLEPYGAPEFRLRSVWQGRELYSHIYVLLPKSGKHPLADVVLQDRVRQELPKKFLDLAPVVSMDVVFTADRDLADGPQRFAR